MKKLRTIAAFTLLEMLIGTGVTSVVGGVIYVVASEGVASFARNASINRSFTEARQVLDQIAADINTAGRTPELVNANGVGVSSSGSAEGVRFYRYGALPTFQIPSGNTSTKTLVINFTPYQKGNSQVASMVGIGDLVFIPQLGFQDNVTSITNVTTSADGSGSMTLNFADTIAAGCTPDLPVDKNNKTIQTSFVPVARNNSTKPPTPATYYTCMIFRQVAYIAVPNANGVGAQLRYYPRAMSTGAGKACGEIASFNSSSAFSNPANYSVLANIYGGSVITATGVPNINPGQPFQVSGTTVTTTLCEDGPDYTNRSNSINGRISANNNFCLMRSTTSARCADVLR